MCSKLTRMKFAEFRAADLEEHRNVQVSQRAEEVSVDRERNHVWGTGTWSK